MIYQETKEYKKLVNKKGGGQICDIFDCLEKRVEIKEEKVFSKNENKQETKRRLKKERRELQKAQTKALRISQLETLLKEENPDFLTLKKIKKLRKKLRIGDIKIQKQYKNKIVKHKVKKKCPKSYKKYIDSSFWENRKKLYYQGHRKICNRCFAVRYIQLHHIVYEKYGEEKDEHLVPLCKDCHELFHREYGVKKNMIKEMGLFYIQHPYNQV